MMLEKFSKLIVSTLLVTLGISTLSSCGKAESKSPQNTDSNISNDSEKTSPEDVSGKITYCVYPHAVKTA